jgi:hypothetical protein
LVSKKFYDGGEDLATSRKSFSFKTEKGRTSAISATAHKLAVIIWNMLVPKVPYKPETDYGFLDQKRKCKVLGMKKLIHKFDITPDLGLQLNIYNL